MKGLFILFMSALAFCASAKADVIKSEQDLAALTEKVMSYAAKGDLAAAFAVMKPYSVVSDAEFQSSALNSKAQRDQYEARYGKSTGYEFIEQKKVGQSLVMREYIEKTERHALPWYFIFYKTENGWVLNSFLWHDQLPRLFFE